MPSFNALSASSIESKSKQLRPFSSNTDLYKAHPFSSHSLNYFLLHKVRLAGNQQIDSVGSGVLVLLPRMVTGSSIIKLAIAYALINNANSRINKRTELTYADYAKALFRLLTASYQRCKSVYSDSIRTLITRAKSILQSAVMSASEKSSPAIYSESARRRLSSFRNLLALIPA